MSYADARTYFEDIKASWSTTGEFLLWGAAKTGRDFYEKFCDRIHIEGFIDSNPGLQGTCITTADSGEVGVYSLETVRTRFPRAKVIITTTAFQEVAYTLSQAGYVENRDFYERRVFETLYHKSVDNLFWFSFLALVVTERCSLRCEKCIHSAPYVKEPADVSLEENVAGCDGFFSVVDRLGRLEVMGGEALLYRPLPTLLKYIGTRYRDRIDDFTITTNGTCNIGKELAAVCRDYRIRVEISDYRKTISQARRNNVERFIEQLEKYQISYLIRPQGQWIDFRYQNPAAWLTNLEALRERYAKCRTSCHALYRKKVYACASEVGGVSAGWCEEKAEDSVPLNISMSATERRHVRDALFALDIGYPPTGYLAWCARCGGYLSPERVPAGTQLK